MIIELSLTTNKHWTTNKDLHIKTDYRDYYSFLDSNQLICLLLTFLMPIQFLKIQCQILLPQNTESFILSLHIEITVRCHFIFPASEKPQWNDNCVCVCVMFDLLLHVNCQQKQVSGFADSVSTHYIVGKGYFKNQRRWWQHVHRPEIQCN